MKKEIAMEWADALESGKYKQGHSYLCRDDRFCCLGVLAELATEKNICKKTTKDDIVHYDGNGGLLPTSVNI